MTSRDSNKIIIEIDSGESKDAPPIVSLSGPGYEALLKKTTKEELTDVDKVALDIIRYLYDTQNDDSGTDST